MSDNDRAHSSGADQGREQGDDFGRYVHNMPDSDVIPTPGNTTSVGTTSVPDALPDEPGNNPSPDPATSSTADGAADVAATDT